VQRDLALLRYGIERVIEPEERDFFWVAFAAAVRGGPILDGANVVPFAIKNLLNGEKHFGGGQPFGLAAASV